MERILLTAHDAGGAEILSAWALRNSPERIDFCLAGPALKVFARNHPDHKPLDVDAAAAKVAEYSLVLTGSGWASTFEKEWIVKARAAGVRCATFLDHWTNYARRFELRGRNVLPDEIWVGDEFQRRLAEKEVPGVPVKLEPNPYFEEMRRRIQALSANRVAGGKGVNILYVTEPTSKAAEANTGDPLAYGYTESQALEGYLKFLLAGETEVATVRIRPHPAEPREKYMPVLHQYAARINLEQGAAGADLAADCAWADWVVGCDSMVMAIALFAGKQVFCAIPPGGKPTSIPFPEIVRLFPGD